MAWERSQGWARALGPCTRVGDLEEAPGSWVWVGSSPTIAAAWGVNHRMEELPLCLSSSLYIWLCNKNKYLLKKEKKEIHTSNVIVYQNQAVCLKIFL